MKKILIVVLIVIVAAAAGLAGAFVMTKSAKGGGHGSDTEQHEAVPVKKAATIKLEERTINLGDVGSSHYLRLTLVIRVIGPGSSKKIEEEYTPLFLDEVINTSSKYTFEYLKTATGKKHLKKELTQGFNSVLKESGWTVTDVLFMDLIME